VRANTGELVTFSAEPAQVNAAIAMGLANVNVLAVAESNRTRLLRLNADEELPTLSPEQRANYVFEAWRGLLHRLAQ
jgi:hypothetical protein